MNAIFSNPFTRLSGKKRRLALAVLLLFLLALPVRIAWFLAFPAGSGSRVALVELGRGGTLRPLAQELEAQGVISNSALFTLYARLSGKSSRIKAGFYQFDDGMRPGTILRKIVTGEVYQRLFAVPEGYSTYQIAEMLEKRGFFKKEAFLEACRDSRLLAELRIGGDSVEGYLLPGSYNILPNLTETGLLREMVQRFRTQYQPLTARAEAAGLSLHQLLTLASMVEKEAVLPEERRLIAAVFANRLRLGMRLQSDPTALYGVRAFAGSVSKQDISRPTPYNTYLIPALPPGPIGNPAVASAEAVLNHPKVPYLYFVARGDGSHFFSPTLQQHNQAVQYYLRSGTSKTSVQNGKNKVAQGR